MRAHCYGSCVAQNYYRAQTLWAPFWFCEQAEQAGVFPASRLFSGQRILEARHVRQIEN